MVFQARTLAGAIAAGALMSVAMAAHADQPGSQVTATSDALGIRTIDPHAGPQAVHKSLQWDPKGRWGVKLDMNQPVGRDMQLRDVQAGAFYRVTPSLRVGGALALSGQTLPPDRQATVPLAPAPQVKLETSFKF
jgi:hypothetical protein